MPIDDLEVRVYALIAEAYARGFREGKQAVTLKILQAAQSEADDVPETNRGSGEGQSASESPAPEVESEPKPRAKRAPRGLTNKILRQVLAHGIGLPMDEVQRRAAEADSRISKKTVYNELYRGTDFYKDRNGGWRLLTEDQRADIRAQQLRLSEEAAGSLGLKDAPQERERQGAPMAH